MGHRIESGAPAPGCAAGLLDPTGSAAGILAGRNPRFRIVAAAAFAVAVVSLSSAAALALALASALAVATLARLPLGPTLRRVVAMDIFIFVMLTMLPFTVPGEPVVTVLGFPASREGFVQAIGIAVKANAIVLMALALFGSIDTVMFAYALRSLRVPDGLVHLILFTVRYIDVLDQEQRRLRTAMKARGFRPTTNWHTYRSIGYLVGMMLVRALERSERILKAMKCRGFSDHFHFVAAPRPAAADFVFAAVVMVLVATLALLEVTHVAAH